MPPAHEERPPYIPVQEFEDLVDKPEEAQPEEAPVAEVLDFEGEKVLRQIDEILNRGKIPEA